MSSHAVAADIEEARSFTLDAGGAGTIGATVEEKSVEAGFYLLVTNVDVVVVIGERTPKSTDPLIPANTTLNVVVRRKCVIRLAAYGASGGVASLIPLVPIVAAGAGLARPSSRASCG